MAPSPSRCYDRDMLLVSRFLPLVSLMALVGCRNTIVEDVRPDAGPADTGGEGEGEGEDPCEGQPPAISVRVADADGFVYCDPNTVRLTSGDFAEVAVVVPEDNDGCRHQGGFGRPGSYVVDVTVTGFAPKQATATVPANACGVPITTVLNVTVVP